MTHIVADIYQFAVQYEFLDGPLLLLSLNADGPATDADWDAPEFNLPSAVILDGAAFSNGGLKVPNQFLLVARMGGTNCFDAVAEFRVVDALGALLGTEIPLEKHEPDR